MKNSKANIMTYGFMSAVQAHYERAVKACDGEIKAQFGRKIVPVDGFIEYLMNTDKLGNMTEEIIKYLTFPAKHDFEKAKDKREDREASRNEIMAMFNFGD